MKKKSCLTLALILVMVQLLSVFAILPVGADGTTKTYEVKKSDVAPVLDGVIDDLWGAVEASEQFTFTYAKTANYTKRDVAVTAKFLYVENEDLIDVYVLIEAQNSTSWGGFRCSRIFINGTKPTDLHQGKTNITATAYNYKGASKQVGDKGVVFEHYFQLTAEQAKSVTFDTYMVDGTWSDYGCYSWADTNENNEATSSKGTLTFAMPKNFDVKKSLVAPVVDGVADVLWNAFEASEQFTCTYAKTANYTKRDAAVTAKFLYVDNAENENLIDVYVLIVATNTTSWGGNRCSNIFINGSKLPALGQGATLTAATYNYKGASKQNGGTGVTFEHHFQLTKEQAKSVTFDTYMTDGTWTDYGCYSWAGSDEVNSSSANLTFVNNVISVETAVGASVRVDTANPKQSGIRFATTVDADRLAAWEAAGATVTTGTLILPTASLAAANIADADFTEAALIAVGMEEGKHYYNIVNQGNEWVKDAQGNELTGTWYGTLFDVKVFDRQFSAIGYVIVEMDGVATVAYGGYVSTNARSIAYVAGEAMKGEIEGDAGNWTTEQEAILKGFYAAN